MSQELQAVLYLIMSQELQAVLYLIMSKHLEACHRHSKMCLTIGYWLYCLLSGGASLDFVLLARRQPGCDIV
jgi:hypothetical protein